METTDEVNGIEKKQQKQQKNNFLRIEKKKVSAKGCWTENSTGLF